MEIFMVFMEKYKSLEKICNEIFDTSNGVTAYINEMENTFDGAFYVPNWGNDLQKLKHYRHIRTQIAHEPNCNESNMCVSEDEEWLFTFYSRIMNQTDPLALYRKAKAAYKKTIQQKSCEKTIKKPPLKTPIHTAKPSLQKYKYLKLFIGILIFFGLLLLLLNIKG